jgi:hypothetical protein
MTMPSVPHHERPFLERLAPEGLALLALRLLLAVLIVTAVIAWPYWHTALAALGWVMLSRSVLDRLKARRTRRLTRKDPTA